MFKSLLTALCVVLITTNSLKAGELHLELPQQAQAILKPKAQAMTLEEVNKKVVNDQIDIQISYENVLQAQKKIGDARAQYFPYGANTLIAMYFLNIWNPLLLVELFTSLPSKVYTVQSEKNMAKAQRYSLLALKENIKNQVAHLYYNILKEESVLRVTKLELALMEKLMKVHEERQALGLGTSDDVQSVKMRLLDLRDAYLKFSAYLLAEKAAFNQMIAETPEEAASIELQTVENYLNSSSYQADVNALVKTAILKSPELVATNYMIKAAKNASRSTKWSIMSFMGIGFSYYGRVMVSNSKVDEAKLNRKLTKERLSNQVHIADTAFHRSLDYLNNEISVFQDSAFFTEGELQRFTTENIPLNELIETELLYLKDYKDLLLSHYESLIKLNDLQRSVLSKVEGSSTSKALPKKSKKKSKKKLTRLAFRLKNAF